MLKSRRQLSLLGMVAALMTFGASNLLQAESDKPAWKQFLNWLPEDTETLFVANGPLAISKSKDDLFEFHEVAAMLPVGPLLSVQDGLLGKALAAKKITCAVEGSRRFTGPKRFGMMPYEGAHIVQFDDSSGEAVRKAFQDCYDKADKKIELAGQRVAVFNEKLEDDNWTYLVVQPRPSLLICATNQNYVEEVLKRMAKSPAKRAFPKNCLSGNRSMSKLVCGQFATIGRSPRMIHPLRCETKPRLIIRTPMQLVWFSGVMRNPTKWQRCAYLSAACNSLEIVTQGWEFPTEALTPKIAISGPGCIEIVATITEEQTARSFIFVLLGRLGHGIFL